MLVLGAPVIKPPRPAPAVPTAVCSTEHTAQVTMPPKRPSEDEPPLIHKIRRIEHGVSTSPPQRLPNNDFSSSVKRKLADSKRTGQACDRCKVSANSRCTLPS